MTNSAINQKLSREAEIIRDAFWSPGLHVGLNYRLINALMALARQVETIEDIQKIAKELEANYG